MIVRPHIWGIALLAVPGIVLTPATAQENATSTLAAQHIARGDAYVDAKQLDQALEEYNEAIRLDPNQPTYYHRRGLLYKIIGSFVHAEDDFSAEIRLEPTSAEGYCQRGACRPPRSFPTIWEKADPRSKMSPSPGRAKRIADLTEAIRLDPMRR